MRGLPGEFGGTFRAFAVGLGVAQATVNDDQHPLDLFRCRPDAHCHFPGLELQATGADRIDAGRLRGAGDEQ